MDIEGVEVVRLTAAASCGCGERLLEGERAGLHRGERALLCLWCLADLEAGRPRPARREPVLPSVTLGAAAHVPAPYGSPPDARPPQLPTATAWRSYPHPSPRRRHPSAGLSLLLALVLGVSAFLIRPLVMGSGTVTSALDTLQGTSGTSRGSSGSTGAAGSTGYSPLPPDLGAPQSPAVPLRIAASRLAPSPPKRSSSTDYRFMRTKPGLATPVAFSPCRPIELVVNTAQAPPRADRLLREAIAEVSAATGLVLTVVGTTTEAPSERRPPQDVERYGKRWSPVLVAWTDPDGVAELSGSVVGLGGPVMAPYTDAQDQHFVSGVVYLDAPAFRNVLDRPDGWQSARAIVMHELAHLVGLTHIEVSSELMHPANSHALHAFGRGDLEGLRQLGNGPCFSGP